MATVTCYVVARPPKTALPHSQEQWRISQSAATATRRRRDRLRGHPQERDHSDAAGDTRDECPRRGVH
jgi:hypothetical protein